MTAPVALPVAVVDRRDRVLDRDLGPVPPDEEAVRRKVDGPVPADRHLRRIRDDLAARGVQDPEDVGHRAADGLVARPAGHVLRRQVQERDVAGDVGADHGVADAVERDLGALLLDEQRLLHDLALDRVADARARSPRVSIWPLIR